VRTELLAVLSSAAAGVPALESGPDWERTPPLTVDVCRAAFDRSSAYTIGVEEELMLVHLDSFELAPANESVLSWLGGNPGFALELRASQIEIVTPVCRTSVEVEAALTASRRRLLETIDGRLGIIAAGTHPFARDFGKLSETTRYRQIEDEFRWAARRALVCGLHVHVGVGGSARTLAVYNAMRSYLPEIAAVAANSPFFEGEDTGLCSIRPKLAEALPRTGVPPVFGHWADFVELVRWGRRGRLFPDSTYLWWDLRPSIAHGTLELRVADAQTRVEDAAAVAALVQATAAWLGDRFDRGELMPVHPSHRISENSWRALRDGVRGHLVDLDTGVREPTRDRVARLLESVAPAAEQLGSAEGLEAAGVLLAGNGADRQRYIARNEGIAGLVPWLIAETAALPDTGNRRRWAWSKLLL
jgi:glutamate---cysteine ligase / carboxylate-amine ligase